MRPDLSLSKSSESSSGSLGTGPAIGSERRRTLKQYLSKIESYVNVLGARQKNPSLYSLSTDTYRLIPSNIKGDDLFNWTEDILTYSRTQAVEVRRADANNV